MSLNCKTDVKGDVLTITVNLGESHGASKSGKTEIIATTSGNVNLGHKSGAVLGLNIYKPRSL